MDKKIKRTAFIAVLVCLIQIFSFSFTAADSFNMLQEISTADTEIWQAASGTVLISGNSMRTSEQAIFASAEDETITNLSFYRLLPSASDWSFVKNNNLSDLSLSLDFYISDLSFMKGYEGNFLNGRIGFMSENYSFFWEIEDLPLQKGWNSISLNFRTAEKAVPSDEWKQLYSSLEKNIVSSDNAETNDISFEDSTYTNTDCIFISVNKESNTENDTIGLGNIKITAPSFDDGDNKDISSEFKYSVVDIISSILLGIACAIFIFIAFIGPYIRKKGPKIR